MHVITSEKTLTLKKYPKSGNKHSLETDIQRKIGVCLIKQCQQCDFSIRMVPVDCPFTILHVLETKTYGVQQRKRRSGKTTELVEIAIAIEKAGHKVYYLTPTESMAQLIRRRFLLNGMVKVMGWKSALTSLRGAPSGVIIADDITDKEMSEVERDIMSVQPHILFAHYWTPR